MEQFEHTNARSSNVEPDYRDLRDIERHLDERIATLHSILLQVNLQEISDVVAQIRRTILILRNQHHPSETVLEYLRMADEHLRYVADPSLLIEYTEAEVPDTDREIVWAYGQLLGAEHTISAALTGMISSGQSDE